MEQIEKLPFFNKVTAGVALGKSGQNLDYWIKTRLKSGEIIALKKGLFASKYYLIALQADFRLREKYLQYLARIIYQPSYLSLEYVLSLKNLIPEAIYSYTSISLKTTRDFKNKLGKYNYQTIKDDLFGGFEVIEFDGGKRIRIATKAKALFDFLYLKKIKNLDLLKYEINEGLRINWLEFDKNDIKEFKRFAMISNSSKMKSIVKIMKW